MLRALTAALRLPLPKLSLSLVALSVLFLGLGGTICGAQTTVKNWWSIDYGLIKVFFTTPKGSISVNIPDDVSAGDTISGTMLLDPIGSGESTQKRNEEALNEYTIELLGANTPVRDGDYRLTIPKTCAQLDVILKDKTGKAVGKQTVGVNQRPQPALPSNYVVPSVFSDDRTVRCIGNFDGNMGSTHVKIDRQEVSKVAESPRQLVFYPPEKKTGPMRLEIAKGGAQSSSTTIYGISLELNQPAAQMYRGAENSVVLTVNGASMFPEPVEVQLENMSPTVADLAGGNKQVVTIPARSPDGFQVTRSLKGIKVGSYDVRATILNPKNINMLQ
jgi:hypothetical protein